MNRSACMTCNGDGRIEELYWSFLLGDFTIESVCPTCDGAGNDDDAALDTQLECDDERLYRLELGGES